jgi:hypothetical protein
MWKYISRSKLLEVPRIRINYTMLLEGKNKKISYVDDVDENQNLTPKFTK